MGITIGHFVPAYEFNIKAPTHEQILRDSADAHDHGWTWIHWSMYSSDLPRLRNAALERARERGWDYLMMQDADVWAVGGGLKPLMATMRREDAAVVTAAVRLRGKEGMNVLPFEQNAVFEAEKAGTGAILINIAAVEQVACKYDGPWFERLYKDPRKSIPWVGEDVFFVRTMRHFGQKVVCDSTIGTGHLYPDYETLRYDPKKNVVTEPQECGKDTPQTVSPT